MEETTVEKYDADFCETNGKVAKKLICVCYFGDEGRFVFDGGQGMDRD